MENLENKNREQLLKELEKSNKRIAELENYEAKHKQTEEAMHNKDRVYRTLLNNLPGFTYRCLNDKNWTMNYISEGCKELTGYLQEDFINNKNIAYNDIIDEGYKQKIWNVWQDALKEKTVIEYEYPIITKSGQIRWVWERGCGIYSDDGNLQFLEGFITDITGRKQAEEKNKILAHAIDSINELVSMTDLQNKIFYVNDAFLKTYGYKENEVLGKPIEMFRSNKTQQNVQNQILPETLTKGWHGEIWNKRKDGSEFHIFLSTSAIRDENKQIIALAGIARDITEQKHTEDELTKHRDHLKELVNERTKELEEKNKKLKQFNKLFVDREFRIKELKDKVKEFEGKKLGKGE